MIFTCKISVNSCAFHVALIFMEREKLSPWLYRSVSPRAILTENWVRSRLLFIFVLQFSTLLHLCTASHWQHFQLTTTLKVHFGTVQKVLLMAVHNSSSLHSPRLPHLDYVVVSQRTHLGWTWKFLFYRIVFKENWISVCVIVTCTLDLPSLPEMGDHKFYLFITSTTTSLFTFSLRCFNNKLDSGKRRVVANMEQFPYWRWQGRGLNAVFKENIKAIAAAQTYVKYTIHFDGEKILRMP